MVLEEENRHSSNSAGSIQRTSTNSNASTHLQYNNTKLSTMESTADSEQEDKDVNIPDCDISGAPCENETDNEDSNDIEECEHSGACVPYVNTCEGGVKGSDINNGAVGGNEPEEKDTVDEAGQTDPFEEEMNSEKYAGISDYIPKEYWETLIKCFSYETVTAISYRLNALEDAHDGGQYTKDFVGLCERLNLDPAFTKYLIKSNIRLKTEEVFSKWEVLKLGEGPRPTVGNFAKIVYYDLDRPDVIVDLHVKIVQDAIKWEKTKTEAKTDKPDDEDTSWQLTRHDVATGKKTFYTCCLCYADEDEGMATLITNFFETVTKGLTRFFRPQFDLKMGRYCCDTTAQVIEERCNGKVIFLLSDYFYANLVCQFAVNFAHSRNPTAEQGNLIPFYLTNKYESAPKVLKGIAGVRWARKQFRNHSWGQLSDCLMVKSDESNRSEMQEIQERIGVELRSSASTWLCDPPYDESTPPPGPALPLNEPVDDSLNSNASFDPDADDNSPIVSSRKSDIKPWYTKLFTRLRRPFARSRRSGSNTPSPIRPEQLARAVERDSDPSPLV